MESNRTSQTQKTGEITEIYPIDLPDLDYRELSSTSENILTSLASNTYEGERWFLPSNGSKVEVTHDNVSRLQLFGDDDPPCTLLTLHMPADGTQVVALNLHGKWWSLNDVLKTSIKSRSGLVMVQSVMERVILFLLSQIIFGVLERPSGEEIYFSPHPMREFGKILWHNGEAVGFYTIKKKGSLCDGFTRRSYQLSVLDTVFVRTQWRRSGLALQILADFCKSLPNEEVIGISCPITPSMIKVCSKYLLMHQDQRDRLYEVEAPGCWGQRRNIWLNIQLNRSTNSEALPRFGSGCTNAKAQVMSNVQQH
ncbi:protein FAM169B isoform X4 [Salvelinus namaycush]|uniref:Protein FAM169B isoform X4 n=1 Tax=Salvelinus namaycush TaxID=8040 RepID=A0A8U1H9J3_SALNM|nr:protein FAM169B isoform X4 [Salvelinus namaycush]XP_038874050.1 protein FAM169B isoform X4 [Salvelinus namaycush]XP_038874051.1 protein FAM169B isoform X4 [Salvelinus namaycush]